MTSKTSKDKTLVMELPSIPLDIRKDVLREFQKTMTFAEARILESHCHAERCLRSTFGTIPCWTYQGLTLFETDKLEDHVHAASEAYVSNVLRSMKGLENPEYEDFKTRYHETIAKAKVLLSEKTKSSSGLFQCRRCKSFDVDTEQKQTRSADEPMTIFCLCTKCGLRFVIK